MRSNTIRFFILLAALLIAVITGVQVHWLNKTYNFEKNEFNESVIKSIRGVYEDLPLLQVSSEKLQKLVEKIDASSYLFRIDSIIPKDSLTHYLHNELEAFDVFTDCRFAVFSASEDQYVYEAYLPSAASGQATEAGYSFPVIKRNHSFVFLFFPNRNEYIISQMTGWIVTSSLLLVVLIGFSASLYYFFKQKFLVEIQKDFINNVTHEFSTPLSVIELSVDGLNKPSASLQPEKHKKYVTAIQYQAEYLKNHINNLVNTVVTDRYNFDLKTGKVCPNDLLKKAVAQLEPLILKKAGVIEWNLEEENTVIAADEENVYLAVFNIINNAVKYSDVPKIIIHTEKNHSKYLISIKDNGIGIDTSQQKKIFKKFYRVQNGNIHNTKGLGLGLYFTKKIIEGHRGKIEVYSIPGIGTEFKIELPLNR